MLPSGDGQHRIIYYPGRRPVSQHAGVQRPETAGDGHFREGSGGKTVVWQMPGTAGKGAVKGLRTGYDSIIHRRKKMIRYIDFLFGFGLLAICAIQDIRHRKIRVLIPLLFGGAGCCLHMAAGDFWPAMAGCLPGMMLLGVCRLTEGAVGAGDGLVLAAAGIFVGFWPVCCCCSGP